MTGLRLKRPEADFPSSPSGREMLNPPGILGLAALPDCPGPAEAADRRDESPSWIARPRVDVDDQGMRADRRPLRCEASRMADQQTRASYAPGRIFPASS